MAIPDYQTVMLPVLRILSDGEPHRRPDLTRAIADEFGLNQEERGELLPSGKTPVIRSRVGWAVTYLKQAKLLEAPKRGVYRMTERGQQVMAENPARVDVKYLERFPEFEDFRARSREKKDETVTPVEPAPVASPEEAIDSAYEALRTSVERELLDLVRSCDPSFFESLVVDLMIAMGYGGSRSAAGRALGRSGDGGVDGVINEDKLGLDQIYLQAKRWENTVGRPEIQKFAGALQGRRARKGVFITTSNYSREAIDYAEMIESRIILIDGERLARLMFDHDLGVSGSDVYRVKRVDSDYFEDT